jgi:amidohydrolase
MTRWREALHHDPELSNREERTREKVLSALSDLRIPAKGLPGSYAVVGVLAPDASGPCVGLRADMDALPVPEATGAPFASKNGSMHACGHDVHTASLLGAARYLKDHESDLAGPVKLLFQPAEEEGRRGGALPMIQQGVLSSAPSVDFVFGLHVDAQIPLGHYGFFPGPMMAAPDHVEIQVRGVGGHAAYPHGTVDAILLASEIVVGLQTLVSRERDPVDPVVLSLTHVVGGSKDNVLPDRVDMEGTLRTFRPETRRRMARRIRERAQGIARSARGSAEVRILRGYPPLVNPPAITERMEARFRTLFPGRVHRLPGPVLGGADLGYLPPRRPGLFLRWGTNVGGLGGGSLHSARYLPPPRSLLSGAAAHVAAVTTLQGPPVGKPRSARTPSEGGPPFNGPPLGRRSPRSSP